jgi:hypothetical protein
VFHATLGREAQAKIARHNATLGTVGKKLLKFHLPSAEFRTVADGPFLQQSGKARSGLRFTDR